MAKDPRTDAEAFMRRLRLMLFLAIALLVVPLAVYGLFLNQRLASFEDELHYRHPQQWPVISDAPDQLVFHPVQGQTVYVPAYSHVFHQDGRPNLLTVTLSVRNTSIQHGIVVRSVRYFDTQGQHVKSHLEGPLRLGPLATADFLVARNDTAGGSGASFLVEWVSDQPVTEPVIETVMIDTSGQQGISFVRRGTVVRETVPHQPTESIDVQKAAGSTD